MPRTSLPPTVVLVIIDGLRPDAITDSDTPALAGLRERHWSAVAETVAPSATVPALTSLGTGVGPATHGITAGTVTALSRLRALTPLPAHLRRHGITTRIVTGEMPATRLLLARILAGAAGAALFAAGGEDPGVVGLRAATMARREPGGLLIVYLDECDRAGHADGWMSRAYVAAARRCDAAVSHLATLLDGPSTSLCITADHGGGGIDPRDHDLAHPDNFAIPLVLATPDHRVRRPPLRRVHLLDIPPTILTLLGAPVPVGYEGRVLFEALGGGSAAA